MSTSITKILCPFRYVSFAVYSYNSLKNNEARNSSLLLTCGRHKREMVRSYRGAKQRQL